MSSLFWPLVALSQLSAAAMVVTMVIWLQHHVGGIVWGAAGGYHPLLLTVALVLLYGEALLSFRVFDRWRVPYLGQKATHATLHTVIIVLTAAGLRAAVLAKDHLPSRAAAVHNYSVHSWLGVCTATLFALQYVAGCVYYGAERFLRKDNPLKVHYPPVHVFFGILMFSFAIASCLTGLNELSIYQIADYSRGVTSGALGNVYGLCMVLFGGLVAFVTTRPGYKTTAAPAGLGAPDAADGDAPGPHDRLAVYRDAVPTLRVDVGDDVTDDGDGLKMAERKDSA